MKNKTTLRISLHTENVSHEPIVADVVSIKAEGRPIPNIGEDIQIPGKDRRVFNGIGKTLIYKHQTTIVDIHVVEYEETEENNA